MDVASQFSCQIIHNLVNMMTLPIRLSFLTTFFIVLRLCRHLLHTTTWTLVWPRLGSCVKLSRWQSPKSTRFIGTRANEREVSGVPPAGYDFVVVSGHADGGQRLAEVSLQVRQDEAVVVASTQEVVSVRREPHRSDILKLEFWQCSSRDRSRFKSI